MQSTISGKIQETHLETDGLADRSHVGLTLGTQSQLIALGVQWGGEQGGQHVVHEPVALSTTVLAGSGKEMKFNTLTAQER